MIDLKGLITSLTFLAVVATNTIDLGRIVGGKNAEVGQFPYQVSLRLNNNHYCGGSIISKKHILTAAHCVVRQGIPHDIEALNVRVGTNNRLAGGVIIPVKRVAVHEDFGYFLNDVALLELEKELIYSDKIQPILMESKEVPDGENVLISGWDNAECCKKIKICGGCIICLKHRKANGACFGDSGGPAVYNGTLVGVCGFVVGGCGSDNPDGYAKLSYHIDWIRKHMN